MSGLVLKMPKLRLGAIDLLLGGTLVALLMLGFIAMSSASIEYAHIQYHNAFHHIQRHGFYLVIALLAGMVTFHIPTEALNRHGWWLLLLGIVLLCLVLVLGREVNGSKRWLALGPFSLQVSEFVKLFMVVYMAGYLVRRRDQIRSNLAGFLKPLAVMALLIVLLLAEPDFGAAVVVMGAVMGMLFLGGARLWQFLALATVCLLAAGMMVMTSDYRMQRLLAYTNPWEHQFDISYQLVQALIAFGRGEWWGVGLGNSVQKLSYLPEAHTDFVFAILAEEMGAIGVLLVLALFALLVGRMLLVARNAERSGYCFGAYLSYGAALLIALQVFINVGVNTGILPTKGLTLPFFSYGGSSLISCVMLVALVARVELTVRDQRAAADTEADGSQ
jgi:cell division protein FtsW